MAFALFHGWELRPQVLGIWVMGNARFRIFVTFTEGGDFTDAVLRINGREDDDDRPLSKRQLVHMLKRGGRLYYPDALGGIDDGRT